MQLKNTVCPFYELICTFNSSLTRILQIVYNFLDDIQADLVFNFQPQGIKHTKISMPFKNFFLFLFVCLLIMFHKMSWGQNLSIFSKTIFLAYQMSVDLKIILGYSAIKDIPAKQIFILVLLSVLTLLIVNNCESYCEQAANTYC